MKQIFKCFGVFIILFLIGILGYGINYFFIENPKYKVEKGIDYSSIIFQDGENDYNTYRIPAMTYNPENNTIFAFAEGRKDTGSDFGNIDMVMKRSFDGGKTWEDMQIIWDYQEIAVQNPAPVYVSATKTLFLHVFVNRTDHYVLNSTDNGATWGIPQNISAITPFTAYSGPAAGHGIVLSSGRILIPGMHIFKGSSMQDDPDRIWGSHIVYSDDNGQTWQLGNIYPPQTNECILTDTFNGSVLMILRPTNHSEDYHFNYLSYSNDEGLNSSYPVLHPDLISPICQVSAIKFSGSDTTTTDDLILHSGPDSQNERVKMTIKISQDNGQTWNQSRLLFKGRSGYSDLMVFNSTHIGCMFENGRFGYHERITFTACDINWIQNK